jgi:hypothetical protein
MNHLGKSHLLLKLGAILLIPGEPVNKEALLFTLVHRLLQQANGNLHPFQLQASSSDPHKLACWTRLLEGMLTLAGLKVVEAHM